MHACNGSRLRFEECDAIMRIPMEWFVQFHQIFGFIGVAVCVEVNRISLRHQKILNHNKSTQFKAVLVEEDN